MVYVIGIGLPLPCVAANAAGWFGMHRIRGLHPGVALRFTPGYAQVAALRLHGEPNLMGPISRFPSRRTPDTVSTYDEEKPQEGWLKIAA